jgi:hypothetical protein
MDNNTNIKDPNTIASTGNLVKAHRSGEPKMSIKEMKKRAIEKIWGNKSPKQKREEREKEIKEILKKREAKKKENKK